MAQKRIKVLGRFLVGTMLLLALFFLLTTRLSTAVSIGNFTLNAYLTGIAALSAGTLSLATLWMIVVERKNLRTTGKTYPQSLVLGSLSALPLLTYSSVWLVVDTQPKGLQNILVWGAFALALFSLPYWLKEADILLVERVMRATVIAVPIAKIIMFYGDFDFYGSASFALVAVALLAYAVAQTPRRWFDYLAPWLLLFSILLANVRTAAVVAALLMLFLVRHLAVSNGLRVGFAAVIGTVSAGFVWLMIGDRLRPTGDPFLETLFGSENLLTAMGTSGRGEAWSYIINNLPSGINWWGQGAGESSYLADEILGIDHPHNEYLRIFYDFGWVGLGLFLVGSLALFLSIFSRWRRNKSDRALAALLCVMAVALLSVTDNPVIYTFVMFPLAVVISAALATAPSEKAMVANSR